ncbi:hypothetical protein [Streptomyces sp. NPDC017993]
MGVTCIGLSLGHQAPVVTAWSTPEPRSWRPVCTGCRQRRR